MSQRFGVMFGLEEELAVPLTRRGTVEIYDGRLLLWRLEEGATAIPHDLVIRDLLQLDHTDVDGVLDFTARHGVVTSQWDGGAYLGDLFGAPLSDIDHGLPASADNERRWEDATAARAAGEDVEANLVADVQQHLRLLQVLSLHWQAHQEGSDPARAWQDHLSMEPNARQAWQFWVWYLQALVPSAASALTVREADRLVVGSTGAELHVALAVQLFNIGVSGITPRKCADPYCPNYLTRQTDNDGRPSARDRDRVGGVMFCTPRCKNRTQQRKWRQANKGGDAKPTQPAKRSPRRKRES